MFILTKNTSLPITIPANLMAMIEKFMEYSKTNHRVRKRKEETKTE